MLTRYDWIRTQSRAGPRLVSHEKHTKASLLAKDHIKDKAVNESRLLTQTNDLFKMKKF